MANLVNIWGESNADIIGDDSSPTVSFKNTSSGYGVTGESIGTGSGVKAGAIDAKPAIDIFVSGASGTAFKVNNIAKGYVSTNSCSSVSFALRVDVAGVIYYIPVYLGAEIT